MRIGFNILCLVWCTGLLPGAAGAGIWKATGQIGLVGVSAELDDSTAPSVVLIRVDNQSRTAAVGVSRYFVQMTEGDNHPLRPVTPDDLVSEHLQKLRELLPQDVAELNDILGNIQADYPQEKIVSVYGRLRQYLDQGRPMSWRTQVENWLAGRRASQPEELAEASKRVEAIGALAKNYLWPRDVAPQSNYTGMVFFAKPTRDPVSIYFQMGEQFIGMRMTLAASRAEVRK